MIFLKVGISSPYLVLWNNPACWWFIFFERYPQDCLTDIHKNCISKDKRINALFTIQKTNLQRGTFHLSCTTAQRIQENGRFSIKNWFLSNTAVYPDTRGLNIWLCWYHICFVLGKDQKFIDTFSSYNFDLRAKQNISKHFLGQWLRELENILAWKPFISCFIRVLFYVQIKTKWETAFKTGPIWTLIPSHQLAQNCGVEICYCGMVLQFWERFLSRGLFQG